RSPAARSRRASPSARITGSSPSVENACIMAGESDSPMSFPSTAQMPQQNTANNVQSNQGRISHVLLKLAWRPEDQRVLAFGHVGGGQPPLDLKSPIPASYKCSPARAPDFRARFPGPGA